MKLYSVKMRASKNNSHISGAEKIIGKPALAAAVTAMTKRALEHSLGEADFINLKIEAAAKEDITVLPALPVSSCKSDTVDGSIKVIEAKLRELDISDPQKIISLLQNCCHMRGAILYDIYTGTRMEPDPIRGVRVTYMDSCLDTQSIINKNHFYEALVLATKVAHAPGMVAELCISDDPNYTTGYLASLKHGYLRLAPVKKYGSSHGGRIFIFDSSKTSVGRLIDYLEKAKILVSGIDTSYFPKQSVTEYAQCSLAQLKKQQLYRTMTVIDTPQNKNITVQQKPLLLFSSNDYLDLANHPDVKQAAAAAALAWGAGTGGSRLTTGTNGLNTLLETKLAEFKGTEAALLFNTGYTANLGVISALADKDTVIFSDEYNHASIIDGCRLSKGTTVIYKHNDMADLEAKIKNTAFSKGIIVSDSVFSMDGDIVNLPAITALAKKYTLFTIIDEAHATGVIGQTGRGAVEYYGHTCHPDLIVGTLSKALGSEGGFVCGSRLIIDYLANKARSFIFSTSQNPAAIGAALKSLELITASCEPVRSLQHNVSYFKQALSGAGIKTTGETAVIPVIIGNEQTALQIAAELYAAGFMVSAIRYPTVPEKTARLRIALMSSHTEQELQNLAGSIKKAFLKHGLLS